MVVPSASWRGMGSVSDRRGPDLRDEGGSGTGNCQFEDIPEELNRWILHGPDKFKDDPVVFASFAAQAVIAFYLGTILDRKSPFLDFPENSKERIPWQQTMRQVQIAQAIFMLRREPGFNEICRRLATRGDLRSAAFEAFAAQLFRERGFTVLARPETGELGQDFDFAVRVDDHEINVEATALTVTSFSAGTIISALGRKRGQLPADKPAAIVCFVPGAWRAGLGVTGDIADSLIPIAEKFLRGTQRINHLIFCEDLMTPFPEQGGAGSFHIIGFRNHKVRFPCPRMDELVMSRLWNDKEVADYMSQPSPGLTGSSELFQWIEWLKGRAA